MNPRIFSFLFLEIIKNTSGFTVDGLVEVRQEVFCVFADDGGGDDEASGDY